MEYYAKVQDIEGHEKKFELWTGLTSKKCPGQEFYDMTVLTSDRRRYKAYAGCSEFMYS